MQETKKSEHLLTIVVPTYNHPDYIEYYLENSDYIDKLNIVLEIHDSSTNSNTEEVVKKYQNKYKNLYYFKYDDVSVDIKTLIALKNVKTKYSYLCGDGIIFNINDSFETIEKYLLQDVDVLTIYGSSVDVYRENFEKLAKKHNSNEIYYDSLEQHIKENLWYMTLYGGSVVKHEVFDDYTIDNIQEMVGTGFIYPYMIYNHKYNSFKSYVICGDYHKPNICKKAPFWITVEKRAVEIWAQNFPKMILKLSPLTMDERETLAKESERILDVFSKKKLLIYKINGNFTYSIYRKYRDNLNKYSGQSKILLFLIAICPAWVIKAMYCIIKRKKWRNI